MAGWRISLCQDRSFPTARRKTMAEVVAMKRHEPQGPILAEQVKGTLRLTLANPPANALSLAVMAELKAQIDRAGGDASVRVVVITAPRSEEHTSELQSRENLVCRLLLEKKKTT